MALDLSDGPGRRTVFGFSPVVVLVLVAFLVGSAVVMAKRGGGDQYAASIERMCKATADYLASPRANQNLALSIRGVVGPHVTALEGMAPPPERVELHGRLLALERGLLEVTVQADDAFRTIGVDGAVPFIHPLLDQSVALNDLYRTEFGIKGCEGMPDGWKRGGPPPKR